MSNFALAFSIALCLMPAAYANDSVARVGAGGLELLKTDDIEMVSEVLEISTSKIKVTYHFLNTSDKDIKTIVAFPMPAFDMGAVFSEDKRNQKPLDSFRVHANGVLVPIEKNRAFLIDNIDVTARLREIGLSDKQIFDPRFTCIDTALDLQESRDCVLTPKQINAIKDMLMRGHKWQIKETAYWEQIFPAQKDVEIVHEYRPFAGLQYSSDGSFHEGDVGCLDQGTLSMIAKKLEDNPGLAIRDVEYILGTGRNWKGPIKNFKLIIKKKDPDEVVTLCFPGKPKRTSPTTLEFVQTNFVPQDRLILLFYDFHYDPGHPD